MENNIINSTVQLAMRCPECGKLEYHELSRFQLSGVKSLYINCSCGAEKLIIKTKKHKEYWIQVPCVVCETRHLHTIPGKLMWNGGVHYLLCHETGLELGFLGPEEKVKELTSGYEEDLKALASEFPDDDYFHNSDIMYEVLNCLHDIAERDALYCQCGNRDVDVDIFPDRLELHCKECDSVNIIYAENEEDLKVIQKVDNIELVQNGFECLDSYASTKKSYKNTGRKRNK
ncbi:MAG: hypothetical protein K9L17_07575 [Clostridiales bacterium]|nr:hypothetical protein [Clostridiales bacterium]MCF8022531.1 hypothetical protein [Clostridiales bacterium]